MSGRFRVVLAAAFGLLGAMTCLAYAESVRDEAERVRSYALARFGGEVARLVVTERPLEAGDVVTEGSVSVRDWVSDLAPAGAIVDLDEVMGRELTVPAAQGAPLTELNFRDELTLSDVPAGRVAVSVPVTDKLGIARGVTRGAHVSAYAVEDAQPRLIATGVEVLSELGSQTTIGAAAQLTIAVLPDEVPDVLAASARGDLRLVIPADDVTAEADGEVLPPEEIELEGEGGEQ